MMVKSICLAAIFVVLGYSVRMHKERLDRRTMKVYLHLGQKGSEPVTICVNRKTYAPEHYDLLCDADRSYVRVADVVQGALHKLQTV